MPRKIAAQLPDGYVVDHVQQKGWEGIKNGELLELAAADGYDAMFSVDKNVSYQQNDRTMPISVVVLHVYKLRIADLLPLIPHAIERLRESPEPAFIRVDADRSNAADI